MILPQEWSGIEAAVSARCSTGSWSTSMASSGCSGKGSCRPRWSTGMRVPAPLPRRQARRRGHAACLRRGHRALARRPLVGDRRPHAGALGRRLCAREPHHHLARVPAALPRSQGAASRASSPRCATASRTGRRTTAAAADGAADADETYFEHAYLARYLGLPLVEGGDLTVREGCLAEDALGLARVHAILRRQDDDYCDPLELRNDSALGVPGLVVRRGNVLIANALGSNLLESSAARLPAATFRAVARRAPAHAVGGVVVRRAGGAGGGRQEPASPGDQERVSAASGRAHLRRGPRRTRRKRVISMLRARPNDYVVHLSQAPVWDRSHPRLLPRSMGLRIFACASPNGYVVMLAPRARGERRRHAGDLHAARGQQQGHLGARLRAGQHFQPPAPLGAAGSGALRQQSLEPGGREPVLVRPLLRTLRRDGAALAHCPGPVRRQPSGRG